MMMIDVIPQEFFDGVPVPSAVTLDGELLGALDDAPAGPWGARDAQRRHAAIGPRLPRKSLCCNGKLS